MEMRLSGETALVTGSTSGLGKEIARLFAAQGARVAVTGRDLARGEAVIKQIAEAGGEAAFFAADLVELASCQALVRQVVERFGALTVLVNNAVAAGGDGALLDVQLEDWERKLRVNLTAPAWLCRAAIPEMIRAGHGSIVNVSSRVAERGTPRLAAYTASKGALNALTRSIAIDYAKQGIRCNSITPGYILHETRDRDMDPAKRARVEGQHLTRLATATDVAWACVYLASRESDVITGIDLPVSGGSTTARGLSLG
jgi:NAD(P)-dependent dehydrogenase (short-subunit alcohol dehydrogenase family)